MRAAESARRAVARAKSRWASRSSLDAGERIAKAFWQRHLGTDIDVLGIETATAIPPMPLVKTPALQLTAGIAQVRLTRQNARVGVRWKP
jgi:hypothetical protein